MADVGAAGNSLSDGVGGQWDIGLLLHRVQEAHGGVTNGVHIGLSGLAELSYLECAAIIFQSYLLFLSRLNSEVSVGLEADTHDASINAQRRVVVESELDLFACLLNVGDTLAKNDLAVVLLQSLLSLVSEVLIKVTLHDTVLTLDAVDLELVFAEALTQLDTDVTATEDGDRLALATVGLDILEDLRTVDIRLAEVQVLESGNITVGDEGRDNGGRTATENEDVVVELGRGTAVDGLDGQALLRVVDLISKGLHMSLDAHLVHLGDGAVEHALKRGLQLAADGDTA